MQPRDTQAAAHARDSVRDAWVAPRVTRLAVSEAELGLSEIGFDAERIS